MSSDRLYREMVSPKILSGRNVVNRQIVCLTAAGVLLLLRAGRADFKQTKSTKFTGGAMAGLVKFASRVGGNGEESDGDGEIQVVAASAKEFGGRLQAAGHENRSAWHEALQRSRK
jgi:hypothetical protein